MCAANQIWCGSCSLRDAIGVVATGRRCHRHDGGQEGHKAEKKARRRRRLAMTMTIRDGRVGPFYIFTPSSPPCCLERQNSVPADTAIAAAPRVPPTSIADAIITCRLPLQALQAPANNWRPAMSISTCPRAYAHACQHLKIRFET